MLSEGFPNMFVMVGPQSASVLANMIQATEHQADWYCDLIKSMRAKNQPLVDVVPEKEREWAKYCNDLTSQTVWGDVGGGCTSWYNKKNVASDDERAGGSDARRATEDPDLPFARVLPFTGGYLKYVEDVENWGYSGLVFE